MEHIIENIFIEIRENKEILAAINLSLQPILRERKEADNYEKYFNKLSFCAGYQINKAKILKTIIYNSLLHNTIGYGLDKKLIMEKVDGIISAEADAGIFNVTADHYHSKAVFKSNDEKDATYIMTCMRFIIQSCLMIDFIAYLSKTQSKIIFAAPANNTMETITGALEKHTDIFLATI
jgi:hypothetical protein